MTERRPVHRQIAAAMANALSTAAPFAGNVIAEQVTDPKRRLADAREGEIIVDCIGQGARFESRNRRGGNRSYLVWVAVHQKLRDGQVTDAALDESGYWAQQVQDHFHEPDARGLTLPSGEVCVLTGSEPFPLSREALFGHGLFLATLQFTWDMVR